MSFSRPLLQEMGESKMDWHELAGRHLEGMNWEHGLATEASGPRMRSSELCRVQLLEDWLS